MATLKLVEFRCITETNESGDDSPYFVAFIGHIPQPGQQATSDVKLLRDGSWDNQVNTGELWEANMTVANGVDKNTTVLVAFLEEDVDPDIVGAALDAVRKGMTTFFNPYASIKNLNLEQYEYWVKKNLIPQFYYLLDTYTGNDERGDVGRLAISASSGPLPLLILNGDGGSYKLRFSLE